MAVRSELKTILVASVAAFALSACLSPTPAPSAVEASRVPTGTPTPTTTLPVIEALNVTPWPTFGASPTPDVSDLQCKTVQLEHYHIPGVVPPDGKEFGDALTNDFLRFYQTSWLNLGQNTLDAFKQKELVNPYQIRSMIEFGSKTFQEYQGKTDVFFFDLAPMGDLTKYVSSAADKLVQEYNMSVLNKPQVEQQLMKMFAIDEVRGKNVYAWMNAIDEQTKQPKAYLTKYGEGLADYYSHYSWVKDGKTLNGYNSLDNRQGFLIKVSLVDGKIDLDKGFDGLRIDYDDFEGANCRTGSNNVAVPTQTPGPIVTPTVPGETPKPEETPKPGETPKPSETPEATATSTPSLPTPCPTQQETATPVIPQLTPQSTKDPRDEGTVEPTMTRAAPTAIHP
jgi:hypothetical protein